MATQIKRCNGWHPVQGWWWAVLGWIIVCAPVWARPGQVQWTAHHIRQQVFTYAQVCALAGIRDAPLIMAEGTQLDCMGHKVSLKKFCQQQTAANFMRALANEQRREVICEHGTRGILEVACALADCHHPAQQCLAFKKLYAANLDLVHSGVWAAGDLAPAAEDQGALVTGPPLSIFAFSQLTLECIYEESAPVGRLDDLSAKTPLKF